MSLLNRLLIIVLCIFLFIGNFGRIIDYSGGFGAINVFELALYFLGIITFILNKNKKNYLTVSYIAILTLGSLFIGLIQFGIDANGIIYNLRFLLILFTSYIIGKVIYDKYKFIS